MNCAIPGIEKEDIYIEGEDDANYQQLLDENGSIIQTNVSEVDDDDDENLSNGGLSESVPNLKALLERKDEEFNSS